MEKLATGSGPNVKITYQPVDVGHFESVEKAVMGAIDQLGDIDILINNVREHDSSKIVNHDMPR